MKKPSSRKLIVVTGTPRSGTTAVGAVLNKAPRTGAIHEPMNRDGGDKSISQYFEIPGQDGFEVEQFYDLVIRVQSLNLDLRSGKFNEDNFGRKIAKSLVGGRTKHSYYRCKLALNLDTIIWKDPFILFCLECFAQKFTFPVVVCYRSPFAIAASFKRLNWKYDATRIAERMGMVNPQSLLAGLSEDKYNQPAYRGALFWLYSYSYLLRLSARYDYFHFLDMDKVIEDPYSTYRAFFRKLDLPYTEKVENHLKQTFTKNTDFSASAVPEVKTHTRNRDMKSINDYWQKTLTTEEISDIQLVCRQLESEYRIRFQSDS